MFPSLPGHFYYLHILEVCAVYTEADYRPNTLRAVYSCRSGVYVQKAERVVVHYFKYVRMPGYKEFRGITEYLGFYFRCIPAGITAYMRHPYWYALYCKTLVFWALLPDFRPVDVPVYRPYGLYLLQTVYYFNGTDIAAMPYFIA